MREKAELPVHRGVLFRGVGQLLASIVEHREGSIPSEIVI